MADAPKSLKASEIGEDVKRKIANEVLAAFVFHEEPPDPNDVERVTFEILDAPDADERVPPFPVHPQTRRPYIGGHIDALVQRVLAQLEVTAAPAPEEEPAVTAPQDPVIAEEEAPDAGYRPDFRQVPRVPRKP